MGLGIFKVSEWRIIYKHKGLQLFEVNMANINKFLVPVGILVVLIITSTIFYHNVEGWRYLDSAYYSVVTLTTIGYGDFTPHTDAGKIFMMCLALCGIGIAFYIFSLIGRYFVMNQQLDYLRGKGRLRNGKGIIKIRK